MMKVTCVIPAHNFSDGVVYLSRWLCTNLSRHALEFHLIVYDDHSSPEHAQRNRWAASLTANGEYVSAPAAVRRNLKIPYSLAARKACQAGHDAVLTAETDAVPTQSAFAAMMNVFQRSSDPSLASVSSTYRWAGRPCYPTHPHWFSMGTHITDGTSQHEETGRVGLVGSAGVPFIFTLWNPTALAVVSDENLPTFWKLDSQLGRLLHKRGFHHQRLIDRHVEHYGGGRAARRGIAGYGSNAPLEDIMLETPDGRLEVRPSPIRGLGLFTRKPLDAGELLLPCCTSAAHQPAGCFQAQTNEPVPASLRCGHLLQLRNYARHANTDFDQNGHVATTSDVPADCELTRQYLSNADTSFRPVQPLLGMR